VGRTAAEMGLLTVVVTAPAFGLPLAPDACSRRLRKISSGVIPELSALYETTPSRRLGGLSTTLH
jgi:hypothetical protein